MLDVRGVAAGGRGSCGCAAGATCDCRDQSSSTAGWLRVSRRRFVASGAGLSLGAASGLAPTYAWSQTRLTPDEALQQLMAGNRRYVAGDLTSFHEDLALRKARTVEKQEPFAALLSCADSRVPVEIVFDQTIGQLFVTRVAGNVATPEIIASLEYGAAVLGTRVIMVLAHQACGAVKAAVAGQAVPGQISALYAPLHSAVEQGGHDYEATARLNAKIQAEILGKASPLLAEQVQKGDLKIVAGYYALGTGSVSLL